MMKTKWKNPVIMIGIDAATWDVIDPLLASGQMPNLARLMEAGAWGRLRSFTQYVSPALWTSITTGKLPEKHGVLDFYTATRHNIQSPPIYDILSAETGKLGLFRWFASWPPPQNAGFTVPDAVARSPETYPPRLAFLNDLLRPQGMGSYINGGLQLLRSRVHPLTLLKAGAELAYETVLRPEQFSWWYRRRLIESDIYADVFSFLLKEHQPEFAAILLYHTDDISHRYWRYRQPELFPEVTQQEVRKYGRVIDQAYIAADQAVGKILRTIPEDALVVVLSDHGQKAGPPVNTPYRMSQEVLTRLGCGDAVWMTYLGYSAYIRSRSNGENDSLESLAGLLRQVRLERDGSPVFAVESTEDRQIVVDAAVNQDADLDGAVQLPGGRNLLLRDVVFTDGRMSGIHSEWGILIMKGPGIRKGQHLEDATILDVAPTILALRQHAIARDMDGAVIGSAFEEGFLEKHPIQMIDSYCAPEPKTDDPAMTGSQLEKLEERLRSLGYL